MDYVRSEFVEQCQLADWLHAQYPNLLWTASAGGMRTSIGTARKMKRMGYSKGTPDIFIAEPRRILKGERDNIYVSHGLFVELKKERGGRVSPDQRRWLNELRIRGYIAEVAHGFNEAKIIIQKYLTNNM